MLNLMMNMLIIPGEYLFVIDGFTQRTKQQKSVQFLVDSHMYLLRKVMNICRKKTNIDKHKHISENSIVFP